MGFLLMEDHLMRSVLCFAFQGINFLLQLLNLLVEFGKPLMDSLRLEESAGVHRRSTDERLVRLYAAGYSRLSSEVDAIADGDMAGYTYLSTEHAPLANLR